MKSTMALLTLVAIAASAPIVAPAAGQDTLPSIRTSPNTIRINYADLDVRSPADRRELDQRLNWATVQVCRFHDGRLEDVQVENRCRVASKRDAVAQVQRNESLRLAQQQTTEMASIRVTAH